MRREQVLEEFLDVLRRSRRDVGRHACHVATWSRQALYEAEVHGISDTHEYDGNRAGRGFERYCCLRSWSDQDVGAEGHQVGDGICQSICGLRKAILYGEVLSLYPT